MSVIGETKTHAAAGWLGAALVPVLVVALAVLLERYSIISIQRFFVNQDALAAAVLGIAIVISAVLVGYFLILREWVVSRANVSLELDRATANAEEQLETIRILRAEGLASPRPDPSAANRAESGQSR